MKQVFFYIILLFGLFLISYIAIKYQRTKKMIASDGYTPSTADIIRDKIVKVIRIWLYYYTNGNRANLSRSVILTIIGYAVAFQANTFLIGASFKFLTFLYVFGVIFIVWKKGREKSLKAFEEGFPEVIQVISASTSSGAGLLQALERCGTDIQGPIGAEFKSIHRRLSIGEDINSIFEDAYSRWPYKEFYSFIIIVSINLEKGGQMREVIQRLARILADNRKMEQKKKTMTSEARMSATIVALIPLSFFIFMKFMMPENYEFITTDPKGQYVLWFVIGSELTGLGIIQWLMKRAT